MDTIGKDTYEAQEWRFQPKRVKAVSGLKFDFPPSARGLRLFQIRIPASSRAPYDEICASTGYGGPFAAETAFRKGATPAATAVAAADFRDQRNAHFQQPRRSPHGIRAGPAEDQRRQAVQPHVLIWQRSSARAHIETQATQAAQRSPIKFLKSKEGTAMVQMGDSVAVERCVQNLNNVAVGLTGAAPLTHHSNNANEQQQQQNENNLKEHKLQLAFSKQPYLSEVTNPYPLPDKSPSYKEYITNKNNRFMNPAMASKNRIQPPSKILHFFNTPPQVTEVELIQVFRDYDVVPPKAVKLFPMKSERSSSGLLEFENTTEAVAAVMACNHAAIESPGTKFPFIMKLCFSSSRSMTIRNGDNNSNGAAEKQDH
ncbi:hypothetical protein NQ318_012971 [Aromia moschata]|uniref:Heterogeneous nuclear ribonucleoprotein L RRM domain-containing protein n=1 Tax=Aromia moschata TaxID=1265417 RepID=A0AAV8XPP8_9CUCU|nr:hypothetical protein NQ318_012971 [Aromia moschata]